MLMSEKKNNNSDTEMDETSEIFAQSQSHPYKMLRCFLVIANCLIMLCGIAVFGVGVWILSSRPFMHHSVGAKLNIIAGTISFVIGIIIIIIGSLGCCGTIRRSRCKLLIYITILLILVICLIAGVVLACVYKKETDKEVQRQLLNTIKIYKKEEVVEAAWDKAHKTLKCCGVGNKTTYSNIEAWRKLLPEVFNDVKKVPATCCRKDDATSVTICQLNPNSSNAYVDDCYELMKSNLMKMIYIVLGILLAVVLVLMCCLVIACMLCKTF